MKLCQYFNRNLETICIAKLVIALSLLVAMKENNILTEIFPLPLQYLISTQKAAFTAVMHLWNRKPLAVYGSRMSESVLAILCHIILGEQMLQKHLEKEKAEKATSGEHLGLNYSNEKGLIQYLLMWPYFSVIFKDSFVVYFL